MLLITEDKNILLLLRKGKPHSKYLTLWCSCRRRRKDGTCKHQRDILEYQIRPDARYRVQCVPPDRKPKEQHRDLSRPEAA